MNRETSARSSLGDRPQQQSWSISNLRYVVTERAFVVPHRTPVRWSPGGDLNSLGPRQSGHAVDVEWLDEWRTALNALGAAFIAHGRVVFLR